jgi:hypothetical protein
MTLGPKRNKVTQDWRRLHNEELHDLYCSTNIILAINLKTMKWAADVVHM